MSDKWIEGHTVTFTAAKSDTSVWKLDRSDGVPVHGQRPDGCRVIRACAIHKRAEWRECSLCRDEAAALDRASEERGVMVESIKEVVHE